MNRILKARIIQCFGSQTDFARSLQISEERLSRIIHGRTVPCAPEKEVIAKKLGTHMNEVFPD